MTNTTSDSPTISICCDPNEEYPPESSCYRNGSIPVEDTIFPEVYDSDFSISTMMASDFVYEYGISCSGNTYDMEFYPSQNDTFYLMENGEIYVNESLIGGLDFWLSTNDYCFASRFDENTTKSVVMVCESLSDTSSDESIDQIFYTIPIAVSVPFLAATFVVYTILPELKNIHGFILRSYVACNFVTFILFAVFLSHAHLICTYFLGLTMQFTILTSHFWLNVMSFDIWWTFRSFKSLHGNSGKWKRKRLIMYSIYAWGSAAIVTGVGSLIDLVPDVPNGVVRPGIREHCWLSGDAAKVIYLFGPMTFVIICNTCLFLLTAITIIRYEKNTARHFRRNSNGLHNHEKQRFKLYLKLFIVMGVSSLSDLLCWFFDPPFPNYVVYIIELPNRLQGLTIFIIFVCKSKIKRQLLKRLGFNNWRFWTWNSAGTNSAANISTKTATGITLRECCKDIRDEQSNFNVDAINV